jgi:hypothetical protein
MARRVALCSKCDGDLDPVTYQGTQVGELWIDGEADRAFLERVGVLVSAHVLIRWDTRGETWEP